MNLVYRLTLIIIASSTLFSGRAENTMFVAITTIIRTRSWMPLQAAGCLSRVLRSDRCAFLVTDNDIYVIEILRNQCCVSPH